MKPVKNIQGLIAAIIMIFSYAGIKAQDTTRINTTTTTTTNASSTTTDDDDINDDDDYNEEARFGIRAGVNISRQKFEDGELDENAQSKFGADFAILVDIPIGDGVFMFQPELHWLQKGSVISDINNDEDITNTFNYIELPLLLRLNFGDEAKLFVIGGPSIGYLLSGKTGGDDIERDLYEDSEWGLHLGAGVGFGPIEIDVRYTDGLSDISANDGDLGDVRNSAFGAGVTLKF